MTITEIIPIAQDSILRTVLKTEYAGFWGDVELPSVQKPGRVPPLATALAQMLLMPVGIVESAANTDEDI